MLRQMKRAPRILKSIWNTMTEHEELAKVVAAANTAAMFQDLALIGALAERHLIDPAKVADWAEFFAKRMEKSAANGSASPEHLRKVATRLRDYAGQLMNITIPPEDAE
jgi:hypothetical protein